MPRTFDNHWLNRFAFVTGDGDAGVDWPGRLGNQPWCRYVGAGLAHNLRLQHVSLSHLKSGWVEYFMNIRTRLLGHYCPACLVVALTRWLGGTNGLQTIVDYRVA